MVMKNGEAMAMTEDIRMFNGTQVMMDGNVMMADGQK